MKVREDAHLNMTFGFDMLSEKGLGQYRSEGFPARDIWFLGTLEQGSARCPEFLGNRRRRRRRRRRRLLEIQVDIQARKL